MNTNNNNPSNIMALIGLELSAVVFIRDYWQFQFDGPVLTVVTPPVVHSENKIININQQSFRDALCSLIGVCVVSVQESNEKLLIKFEKELVLEIFVGDPSILVGDRAWFENPPDYIIFW